jgi:hypothetical protein
MGPLPTYSVICRNGSVLAIRSGMTKAIGVSVLPSASKILGNGFLSTHLKVRSLTAVREADAAGWPALFSKHGHHRLDRASTAALIKAAAEEETTRPAFGKARWKRKATPPPATPLVAPAPWRS